MQGVQLAASKLTLHSGQIKVITITGGVMFQELSNEQAYRSQLAIKKGTETSPLPGLYLSNCKADKKKKKRAIAILNRTICIATGRQRDWTLTHYRG